MSLVLLPVLATLLAVVRGGQIQSGDVQLDFASAKYMSKLSFRFQLTEPLQSSDYLLVTMPFQFHDIATATAGAPVGSLLVKPIRLVVTWNRLNSTFNYTGGVFPYEYAAQQPAVVYISSIASTQYYIQLQYLANNSIYTPTTEWHVLQFQILDENAYVYQTPSQLLIIKMRTVSSYVSNAIIYDENDMLAIFTLQPQPPTSITLSVRYAQQSTSQLLNQVNSVYLGN